MNPREHSGVWECFIPGLGKGAVYKYHIRSRYHMIHASTKPTRTASTTRLRRKTASIVWDPGYEWDDARLDEPSARRSNAFDAPMSIYEVHLGSWMRVT